MVAMAATKVGMGSPPMATRVATATVVAMVEVRLPMVVVAVATVAELPSRDQAEATQTREPSLSEISASMPRSLRSLMCSEEIE